MTNKNENKDESPKESGWAVYLLQCKDGTFYCGIARDVTARVEKHNAGSGAKYTRGRRPVSIIAHTPSTLTHSEALKLEYQIKRLPKRHKESAIKDYKQLITAQ